MGDSVAVGKEPCPECGSKDNLVRYSDGHAHCFGMSCTYREPPSGGFSHSPKGPPKVSKILDYERDRIEPLPKRSLRKETVELWDYHLGFYKEKPCQVAVYRDETGELKGHKFRFQGKEFLISGSIATELYGRHLWRDSGKMIVITEGEIDALSYSQATGNKWPVVSVPTGSKGAAKAIVHNIEWLMEFERVVFMFDNDEAGRAATLECAQVMPPGRAFIATLPLKDANEMLVAGRGDELVNAAWQAKVYSPPSVVTGDELADEASKPIAVGIPWPWPTLTKYTYGRRRGEIYGFGAGTGIGKTDAFKEVELFTLRELGLPVGILHLEENPTLSLKVLAGKSVNKRFHVPGENVDPAEVKAAISAIQDRVIVYDHRKDTCEWATLKKRIRFMAQAHGVKDIFLDNLTAVVAGEDDEKKALDRIMQEMKKLALELDVSIYYISHLTTPEGKSHEEGGRVMEKHFRGSRAIAFWSDFMFGLERNKQEADEDQRMLTTFRILKDRYTGDGNGQTFYLKYNRETGRLLEHTEGYREPVSFHDDDKQKADY